jgi:hypothetical protein
MATLEEILKEEYEKNIAELMDPRSLLALIEETMENVSILKEATQQVPFEFGEKFKANTIEFTYSAIPMIPISELGWASLNSNDKGAQAKRAQLEQFLGRIRGGSTDLRTKLIDLNKFLNDPVHASQLSSKGETEGERIASALSYLVFFKTLTEIITNFNAASAGFNFESFLGVLLGGGQIATGNKTIADLTDGDGHVISLKLYAEKSAAAGGSWTDLVNDLIKSPLKYTTSGAGKGSYMQYVVAMKTLEGEDLQRKGTIDFYRYVLSLDNIVQIMYNSADVDLNGTNIRFPQAIVDNPDILSTMDRPKQPSQQDVEELFVKIVQQELATATFDVEELLRAIDYSKDPKLFIAGKVGLNAFARGPRGSALGWDGGVRPTAPIVLKLQAASEAGLFPEEDTRAIHSAVHKANEIAREEAQKAAALFVKYREGMEGGYASSEDSVTFYNRLAADGKTPLMQRALLFSLGYQNRKQYDLRKADIKGIQYLADPFPAFGSRVTGTRNQKTAFIGRLEIGREKVQEMLNSLVTDLNQNMFKLFENLKILNDSLQSYFAGALQNNELADTAIEASTEISTGTEEIKSN